MAKYFWDLSATFGDNTDIAGQSTAGSANANTLDTIIQKTLAVLAVFGDYLGGVGTVGGTADAITLTSSATYPVQSLATGVVVAFKAGSANTGAATINVDALGVKAIRRQGDSALSANDIVASGVYLIRYDTAYNAAAGAWVLLNPTVSSSISAASTTEVLTGTDASKYATADAIAALWEKGSDIASAGTISIGEGGFFHVTGTTTITDIDWATAKNGRGAWLVFDGALTLTYNATTLVLPGAANITTAAGDRGFFIQDASDNVICLTYIKADGTPVASSSGGITLLETLTTTSGTSHATTVSFATYRKLYVEIDNVSFTAGVALQIAASSNSGGLYGTAVTLVTLGAAGTTVHGWLEIGGIQLTSVEERYIAGGISNGASAAAAAPTSVSIDAAATGALTNIRFSGGTFDLGAIRVYGVK